jgi:hypothetical protein
MTNNSETTVLEPTDLDKQLRVIDLADFLSLSLPRRELLLSPFLPKAGLVMVHAYRGVGKTHISLGIAYAVAKGGKFLNWNAEKSHGVLYIDGEMPAVVLQERLARIVLMNGDKTIPSKLRIITPDLQPNGMPDLSTTEGQEMVNHYIDDTIDPIIVDNISCLAPSIKENDSSDWAALQTWILMLRSKGKSVLLVHHSGKGGTQRGTSKKEDVLDTVIFLERPNDYVASQGARFIVLYEKNRGFFGDDAKPFECQLSQNEKGESHWTTKALDESTYESVINLFNDGLNQTEIAEELDIHKGTVSKYVKRARQEGKLTPSGGQMSNSNETSNATEMQPIDLIALSLRVIQRNKPNHDDNLDATQQSKTTTKTDKSESCQVSSSYEGNHATAELRQLIKQVSQNYGGDDEAFLKEYIEDVLANNDIEKALACFRELAKQTPPV